MSRLILVEGIPGSGKSTTARRLAQLVRARGNRCDLFLEGDAQPADLCWQWWVSREEFEALLRRWPDAADTLRASSWRGRAGVAIAYNQLDRARFAGGWGDLERAMDGREPFNGVLPPERFVALHARRWAEFGADEAHRTGFVVFEAALLQDPLVELMLFADWDGTQIGEAIRDLLSGVADLSPLVLRLVTADPAATVGAAAAERVDEHGNSWWHEGFLSFTADTPWARVRGLSREEAGLTFLRQRLALEDELRDRLPVTWVDVSSTAGGSGAWKELDEVLATIADRLVAGGTASTGGWPRGS